MDDEQEDGYKLLKSFVNEPPNEVVMDLLTLTYQLRKKRMKKVVHPRLLRGCSRKLGPSLKVLANVNGVYLCNS